MPDTGRALFNLYNNPDAGPDVLAHRLQKMFVPMKTESDMALHNDILAEVLLIIKGNDDERIFLKGLVDLILYEPKISLARSSLFDCIWAAIKHWDVETKKNEGYHGLTGNNVGVIVAAIKRQAGEPVKQKRWLFKLAGLVLEIGQRKGNT